MRGPLRPTAKSPKPHPVPHVSQAPKSKAAKKDPDANRHEGVKREGGHRGKDAGVPRSKVKSEADGGGAKGQLLDSDKGWDVRNEEWLGSGEPRGGAAAGKLAVKGEAGAHGPAKGVFRLPGSGTKRKEPGGDARTTAPSSKKRKV